MTAPVGRVDLDLHGIVGVRLEDAGPEDVAVVRRQLGLAPTTLSGAPDLTVRFVDHVPIEGLTYVGQQEAAFDGERFVLLTAQGRPARVVLAFDTIGRATEIVCQRGLAAVPHLVAIVNLTALSKGVLPLHASAFTHEGRGVLVTGWAKSGKTEALLAAARRGAHYVGDEWVYLTEDGVMRGLPEPVRLWAWHLDQLPQVWAARSRAERARVTLWRSLARATSGLGDAAAATRNLALKAVPVLQRQAYLLVPPEQLFGADRLDLHGNVDFVVLVLSTTSPGIRTGPAGMTEVSARMAASLAEERRPLLTAYHQFRYAFPDRHNHLVEHADEIEARLLSQVLDSRPAAKVTHPYPCDIAALGDAVLAAAAAGSGPGPGVRTLRGADA